MGYWEEEFPRAFLPIPKSCLVTYAEAVPLEP